MEREEILYARLNPGDVFEYDGTFAVMSEYGYGDSFIIGSGEIFWGGTSANDDRDLLRVKRITNPTLSLQDKLTVTDKFLPDNFWTRLQSFISNIDVSDLPGEEEKGMILHVCEKLINTGVSLQEDAQERYEIAIDALNKIARPITYLRNEAEKEGSRLDLHMALQLVQQAGFYRDIAEKALLAIGLEPTEPNMSQPNK
jgi:hypothetical protein